MQLSKETVRAGLFLSLLLVLVSCSTTAIQFHNQNYRLRAETQSEGGIDVSAVVLSPQETLHAFSLPLADKGIQPVWLSINNQEDKPFSLMLLSIDPNYYSPSEVAWKFQGYEYPDQDEEEGNTVNTSLDNLINIFLEKHVPVTVLPHSKVTGFIYTHLDPGAKAFAVELVGERDTRVFDFVQLVPGFDADFMRVNFDGIYKPAEIKDLDLKALRHYLRNLPCCVMGGDHKTPGDPLNLVIVGDGQQMLATLIRRGWDLTETIRTKSVWRTVASSLFGTKYRTSPISPLFLFGRSQDIALQKTRNTVDERNHLRLWKAPVTLEGNEVWVGQISRDIGVKVSSKTLVTHKIDPIVDEARLYITMDLAAARTMKAYGYVKGVGYSDKKAPKYNYTDDPYYTDGLRVVLIMGEEKDPRSKIKFLNWEIPEY